MSKTTLQSWLDEKTDPSVATKPKRPEFELLHSAAIATAASVDAVSVPGTLTSFVAEIEGKFATLQIKFQRQKTFRVAVS